MKVTIKELKGFNPMSDNDQLVAGEFCKEALSEVNQRVDAIEQICDLRQILDDAVLCQATNALAGIRHITLAVESVAEAHHGNQLGEVFSNLHAKFVDQMDKAEGNYRWLCMLFPSSEPLAMTASQ